MKFNKGDTVIIKTEGNGVENGEKYMGTKGTVSVAGVFGRDNIFIVDTFDGRFWAYSVDELEVVVND